MNRIGGACLEVRKQCETADLSKLKDCSHGSGGVLSLKHLNLELKFEIVITWMIG
jgi:hypothetical protein